jgi:hypothetical protein
MATIVISNDFIRHTEIINLDELALTIYVTKERLIYLLQNELGTTLHGNFIRGRFNNNSLQKVYNKIVKKVQRENQ